MATGIMKTDGSGLSPQYQTLFDKQLLMAAQPLIVTAQFAQKKSLPKNKGATAMRFFRPIAPDRTRVSNLVEGVPLATFQQISYTPIDVTLAQVGSAARYSDILSNTDLFSTLDQSSKMLGNDAAVYVDFKCVTQIVTGVAAANRRYSGATTYSAFNALTAAQGKLTINDLLGAYTKLTGTRAKKPEGAAYPAILPYKVAYDVKQDTKFIDAGVRGNNKGLFNGDIGTWYGNTIYETTEPWIDNGTELTYDGTGANYTTMVLGREHFGAPIMAGQSPFSPSMIVVNTADSMNPLNQFSSIGWKGFWATVTLNDQWAVTINSKTTFA